jgi:hypothetical protein
MEEFRKPRFSRERWGFFGGRMDETGIDLTGYGTKEEVAGAIQKRLQD